MGPGRGARTACESLLREVVQRRSASPFPLDAPVVVGGTGGSGTRVVARILASAGRFLGARLNASYDAVDFAQFDWEWGLPHLLGNGGPAMSAAFEEVLERHLSDCPAASDGWGWKHPHSYLLIPFLAERFQGLRFVHVVRDGRALALSSNVNQLRRYGGLAGVAPGDETVSARLRYWSWANLRAAEHGQLLLGQDRYLRVRLEDLCREPEVTIRRLLEFTGDRFSPELLELVSPAADLWRGRELPLDPATRRVLDGLGY